jgi:hypothetical protein
VASGGGFIAEGGGNLVCRINPSTCGDQSNAKYLFIKTFIENPVDWYSIKLNLIGKYWFSSAENFVSVVNNTTSFDLITNGLLLVIIISSIFLLFSNTVRKKQSWILLIWFSSSISSAYFLIFSLVHFEVRYFYFPKIFGLVMFLIILSFYLQPSKKIISFEDKSLNN